MTNSQQLWPIVPHQKVIWHHLYLHIYLNFALRDFLVITQASDPFLTLFLQYIALISVFRPTDGAAKIVRQSLSFYLPRDKYSCLSM